MPGQIMSEERPINLWAVVSVLLAVVLLFVMTCNDHHNEQEAKIEQRDSVLEAQRDSALELVLKSDLRGDSLQTVINRRELDIQELKAKFKHEKENILQLNADSTLRYFLRATGTP
jgi:biopolymer transport protein ExbD